ncbi:hypothetical protein HY468_04765 [Candidatus Roizmanbacteria bacterium]|nr:hypothetical protein [Candidatus Roizmanbacteria bacterium]
MNHDGTTASSNFSRSSGQALFEILIAIAVLVLIISGSVAAVNTSLKNTTYARNKALSVQYAQESLELARYERDDKGLAGVTAANCGDGPVPNTPFTRTVTISGGGNERQIDVDVWWNERDLLQHTRVSTILSDRVSWQ